MHLMTSSIHLHIPHQRPAPAPTSTAVSSSSPPSTARQGPGGATLTKQGSGSTRLLDLSEEDNMTVATIMKQQKVTRNVAIQKFMQQKTLGCGSSPPPTTPHGPSSGKLEYRVMSTLSNQSQEWLSCIVALQKRIGRHERVFRWHCGGKSNFGGRYAKLRSLCR